jgi:AraC family transcriptional regulator of adaptative response/methylated-DNA-[protein]-cysteine methyltransferase
VWCLCGVCVLYYDGACQMQNPMQGDARIADAIRRLDQSPPGSPPDLSALAACAGLSQFHFQKLFRKEAGVSPKRYLQHLNAERARALLQNTTHENARRDTLSVTCALNLSSTSRLHDLTLQVLAASPQEVRKQGKGMTLRWGIHPTPWGSALYALSAKGLCALSFLDPSPTPISLTSPPESLLEQWPFAQYIHDVAATAAVHAQIFPTSPLTTPAHLLLHLHGTNLQVRVWAALLSIPPGHTTSYGALSDALDLGGPRPVASAVGRNPIAGLIPCHRVLRASGALAGYRWGLARKAALLYHEASLGL